MHTLCNCPSPFGLDWKTLPGCTGAQSHAAKRDKCVAGDNAQRSCHTCRHFEGFCVFPTYRRAKAVSDLMGEGDVRHLRGHVRGVVLHGDNASVQGLPLPIGVQSVFLTDAS